MATRPNPGASLAPLPECVGNAPDQAEREVLSTWRERGTFEAVQAARADAPPFVFWEGPPTANGRPGIHHVMARTIKDAVCRWQTMLGKRVVRKAGWDTHGLPVELEVERELGISGKPQIERFGVAEFNRRCRESVWKYRREWEELSERMGFWLDYENAYVTYAPEYVESVWAVLARFHAAGLVYKGKRVVPFCGRCGTGLSSHELGQPGVYQDLSDPSVIVRLRLERAEGEEPESLLAWTTTPWTLPSNVALAVHPRVEYVRARVALTVPKGEQPGSRGHEVVWVAAARAAAVLPTGHEVLGTLRGADLVGRRYLPLFEAAVPEVEPGSWTADPTARLSVVAAEYVTTEDGTGIVHQAPSYGAEDWDTAQRHRLPVLQAVGPEGRFVVDVAGVRAGTFFKDADEALMEDLKARGLLFKKAREPHSYPHCWRCKTPLFYFATPAWYLRTSAYKERMLELNRQTRWVPREVGEKRLGDWLENNVDWNISRERYWGTPLPFWECDRCDAQRAIGSVAELEALAGPLPEGFDNHKPLIDTLHFPCEGCGGTMRRTTSVADCWLDSGSMPYAQYGWPRDEGRALVRSQFPADFIAEGLDQTRGWFYTLLAVGAFLTSLGEEELPDGPIYRSCVVNGLLLDKDGVKMSKSLGNVVDPWKAIATHGIDALRWYLLASGAPWLPKRFDEEGVLEVRRRFFGTLVNSYRFLAEYARVDGWDPGREPAPPLGERPEIDRWLVSRSESLLAETRRRMVDYDLVGTCRAIEDFVVDELSNWYIRRNRRRFWKGDLGADKRSAHGTLHGALANVALCMAPFAPFLAELLWERLAGGATSVHAERLPEPRPERIDPELEQAMETVAAVVRLGRALRERLGLRVRQPLRSISVRSSDERALALLRSAFATHQVLDELNVKAWGSLAADDGELVRLRAKANFRTLGKKLGGRMKEAAAAISTLGGADVARLRRGESLSLTVAGEELVLEPGDVEVQVETNADFELETDGRLVVFLDTELDEELRGEGWAREAVSRINGLRKEQGLALEQRIRLRLDASGHGLHAALARHRELLAHECLASQVELDAAPAPGEPWSEWVLEDGQVLRATLAPLG